MSKKEPNLKVFDKTVKCLMEVMSKKRLAQLVAAFMILEEEDQAHLDSIRDDKC